MEHIHIIVTGGTIDSVFDTSLDTVVVSNHSTISTYLRECVRPNFTFSHEVLTLRDSRDITENLRMEICSTIEKSKYKRILVSHGTYTMAETLDSVHESLKKCGDINKTIVLTGSMLPLHGFSPSDAPFNLGFAISALFTMPPGAYLAMNGQVFYPHKARKDIANQRFVEN